MPPTRDVLERLRGGDLRSTGAADEVAREAIADPSLVPTLFEGMNSREPVMRMRCADALEKATRVHPERLQSHSAQLLRHLTPSQQKEVLWHVLQMTPRVRWRETKREAVFLAVEHCLSSSSSIVKTCAMQAMVELSAQFPAHFGRTEALLRQLSVSGTPAMRSRGIKLLRTLVGANPSIEGTSNSGLRPLSAAPHVKR